MRTVGWKERVVFPEWKVGPVVAKVDTGALTSALHVDEIEPLTGDRLRFDIVLSRTDPLRRVSTEARVVRVAIVRPTSGVARPRFIVETLLRVGPVEKRIELGLVCRQHMRYRMLIGRAVLSGTFLVDASRAFVLSGRRGGAGGVGRAGGTP